MASSVRTVRFRPRLRGALLRLLPYLVVVPWLAWFSISGPNRGSFILVLLVTAGFAVIRLLELRHLVRSGWAVELDPDAVHWHRYGDTLPWSRVGEIRVFMARGWRRLLPHRPDRVVLVTVAEADFAARARSRALGSPIYLHQVRATAAQVTEAVRRFTDVPVHDEVVTTAGYSRHL